MASFQRVRIDDTVTKYAATPPSSTPDATITKGRNELRQFFGPLPLVIFGRRYRPFCDKDGAVVFGVRADPASRHVAMCL